MLAVCDSICRGCIVYCVMVMGCLDGHVCWKGIGKDG